MSCDGRHQKQYNIIIILLAYYDIAHKTFLRFLCCISNRSRTHNNIIIIDAHFYSDKCRSVADIIIYLGTDIVADDHHRGIA